MIKVLFVYSDIFCSCTRKRSFEIIKFLIQHQTKNIQTYMVYHENLQEKFFQNHDIILFQRLGANGGRISPRYRKELFRLMDKYKDKTKYIYDIDDLIFDKNDNLPIEMMKKCHMSLAPNKFMELKQKEYNKNTHVVRTHVDLEAFNHAPSISGLDKSVINIGWFSGNGLGIDIMDRIFPKIFEKFNGKINIHFFSIDPFRNLIDNKYKNNIIKAHGLLEIDQMFSVLKNIDFIINPMDNNQMTFGFIGKYKKNEIEDFINCKSEIKYVNAGAAGIPIITSNNPAYSHCIKNGKNGFIANSDNEWIKYLDILINNKNKRKKIGNNAKLDVYNNYSSKKVSEEYLNLFNKVLSQEI